MVEKGSRRGPGRPKKFDPDEVLDKVIDVFWELGYEASDTETLCRYTGLTKPSLYNTFGPKEDLFVAAINRYRHIRSNASLDAMAATGTPSEGIRSYFLNLAQNVAGPGHPTGCLIFSVAMPLCDRMPKVAAALDGAPKESSDRMAAYLNEQKAKGKLPKSFNNAAAIALIQDLSAAMIMQARAGAPLEILKNKATRNADLVLFEGKASAR